MVIEVCFLYIYILNHYKTPYLIYMQFNIRMSKDNIQQKLNEVSEITLTVKGRKSGKDISRSVWFSTEGNTLYLLPVEGSQTLWYKNMLADPTLKISFSGIEISATGKPITDNNRVREVAQKFRLKYGNENVKKYYINFDAAAEVPI